MPERSATGNREKFLLENFGSISCQPKTFLFSQPSASVSRSVLQHSVAKVPDPNRPSSAPHQNSQTKNFFYLSSVGPAQVVLDLATQRKRVAQRAATQCCQSARPQPSLKCSTQKLPNKKFSTCRALDQPKSFLISQPSASVSRSVLQHSVAKVPDPNRPSSAPHKNSQTKKFLLVERWTSPSRS
jgi:hypothetical protein